VHHRLYIKNNGHLNNNAMPLTPKSSYVTHESYKDGHQSVTISILTDEQKNFLIQQQEQKQEQ